MKTLTLVLSPGQTRLDLEEVERLEAADQVPRASLFERTLNSDMLDEKFLLKAPKFWRLIYKVIPTYIAQFVEAMIVKRRYDGIISWSEHLTLPLAALLKLTRSRIPHVGICYTISEPRKARIYKRVHSHFDRMVVMNSSQLNFALNELKIPPAKIVPLHWWVDQKFWRPMDGEVDMICSSGRELRDYSTLVRAVRDLNIRCHIAAKYNPQKRDYWVEALKEVEPLPPHITIGYNESIQEVRNWYARSRFIVVPLLPVDNAIGSTVILESMAMGKAVICTRVKGEHDIILDGKTGIYVPPQDPSALREAIRYLWEHPQIAKEMGKAGRKRIEEHYTLDHWVNTVKTAVEEAIAEKSHRRSLVTR